MPKLFVTLLSLASIAVVGISLAAEGVHWSYSGPTGPDHWGELSAEFSACSIGLNQSPVNITNTLAADLDKLTVDYNARATSVINNGHTLQINVAQGSWLHVGDEKFQLLQFHFHSPSEHQVNNELFPLAAHFVHENDSGALAVIGVFFREGAWNDELAKIGAIAPRDINQPVAIDMDLTEMELWTDHENYYRYSGSLTTPPCTEGVRWFVLKEVGHIDSRQVANFVALIGEDARGPQPINARIILEK